MLQRHHAGRLSFGTLLIALGVFGASVGGCDDTPQTTNSSTGGSAGAGGESGAILDVLVSSFESIPAPMPIPVAANVRVLFHPPGGGPLQEAVTDATGHVQFKNIDWSKGSATLTAISDDTKTIHSLVDVTPENIAEHGVPAQLAGGKADAYLYTIAKGSVRKTVSLGGQLLNQTPNSHLIIGSTVRGTRVLNPQGTYALEVVPDQPFSLITIERVTTTSTVDIFESTASWRQFESAPLTGPSTMDLDLAAGTPLTPSKSTVKVEIPGGVDGPFGKMLYYGFVVESWASPAVFGLPVKAKLTAGGFSTEYGIEYIDFPGQPPVRSASMVFSLDKFSVSSRLGLPVDGEVFSEFVPPPTMNGKGKTFIEPVTFQPLGEAYARLLITDPQNGDNVWQIDSLDSTATSIAAPPLPDADMAKLPATCSVRLHSLAIAGFDPTVALYLQFAASQQFHLDRPAPGM